MGIFLFLGLVCKNPGFARDEKPFSVLSPNVVRDQAGRKIEVKKPFKRIISLYGAHTENLFALGLDKEIIGVSTHEVYPPAATQKPTFSYHEGAEKFLAARPDLVLIRPMIDRGYAPLMDRLQRSGITVVSLQPGNVQEMFRYWKVLGVLAGKKQNAQMMIDVFKKTVSQLKEETKSIEDKKKVYFEAIHRRMKTFSPQSMAVFALKAAGGINVAADAQPVRGTNIAAYGKERILAHAREIDIYLAQYGAMNHVTKRDIETEPGFKAIKAVDNGDIHIISEMIVSRPTMRLLKGIFKIGRILYPTEFPLTWKEKIANRLPY